MSSEMAQGKNNIGIASLNSDLQIMRSRISFVLNLKSLLETWKYFYLVCLDRVDKYLIVLVEIFAVVWLSSEPSNINLIFFLFKLTIFPTILISS